MSGHSLFAAVIFVAPSALGANMAMAESNDPNQRAAKTTEGRLAELEQKQKVTRGANSDTLRNKGWQVAGSYVLTGEAASHKSVVPRQVFDPVAGTWGAFEVVGRVSQLNVDEKAFPTYADPAKYAQSATAWGAGLNWYWNRNVKWMFDYEHTTFRGSETGGRDRAAEDALLIRAQLAF